MGGIELSVENAAPPRLPRIAAELVDILNAVNRSRSPLTLPLAGREVTWHLDRPASPSPLPVTLGMTLGIAPAALELSHEVLAALTAHLPLRRPLSGCDSELCALWLEYALLEWFEPLETRLTDPVRLHGEPTTPASTLPVQLPLRLEIEGQTHPLRLSLSADGARELLPVLDTYCPPLSRPCSSIPLPAQWIIGHQDLTFSELCRLVPGDVVMLERPAQGMAVVIAGRMMASVELNADRLRLLNRPVILPHGDFNMTQPTSDTDNQGKQGNDIAAKIARSAMDKPTLDQLPVRLVCEIGRLELSLGELRELDQGSLLPMSRPVEAAVDIVVNGRNMGRGRLVEIGDGLGVQIVRIANDD